MLPLIFVYAFDVNVEQTGGIHHESCDAFNMRGEICLIRVFDLTPSFAECRIQRKRFQLSQIL